MVTAPCSGSPALKSEAILKIFSWLDLQVPLALVLEPENSFTFETNQQNKTQSFLQRPQNYLTN